MAAHDPYAASNPYAQPGQDPGYDAWQEPRRTSVASVLSLISALIFCIPILTQLLGLLFGVIGLISVSVSGGRRKGTGLAIAGILISLLVTAGYAALTFGFIVPFGKKAIAEVTAISEELVEKIEVGSIDDLKAIASPSLEKMLDERQITTFRNELETEYGAVQSATFDLSVYDRFQNVMPQNQQNIFPAGMRIDFERGSAAALVVFDIKQNPTSIADALQVMELHIERQDGSILTFPYTAEELNQITSDSESSGGEDG